MRPNLPWLCVLACATAASTWLWAADPKPPQSLDAAKKLMEKIEAQRRAKEGGGTTTGDSSKQSEGNVPPELGKYRQASKVQQQVELKAIRAAIQKKQKYIALLQKPGADNAQSQISYQQKLLQKLNERLVAVAKNDPPIRPLLSYPIKLNDVGHVEGMAIVSGVQGNTRIMVAIVLPKDRGQVVDASSNALSLKTRQTILVDRPLARRYRPGQEIRFTRPLLVYEMAAIQGRRNQTAPVARELDLVALEKAAGLTKRPASPTTPNPRKYEGVVAKQKQQVIALLKERRTALLEAKSKGEATKLQVLQIDTFADRIKRLESGSESFDPVLLNPLVPGQYGHFKQKIYVEKVDGTGFVALANLGQTPLDETDLKSTYVRVEGVSEANIKPRARVILRGIFRVEGPRKNKQYSTYAKDQLMVVKYFRKMAIDMDPREAATASSTPPKPSEIPEELKPFMAESDRQRKAWISVMQADARAVYRDILKIRSNKRYKVTPALFKEHNELQAVLNAQNERVRNAMNPEGPPFAPFLLGTLAKDSIGKLPESVDVIKVIGADRLLVRATLPLTVGEAMKDAVRKETPQVELLLKMTTPVTAYKAGEAASIKGIWQVTEKSKPSGDVPSAFVVEPLDVQVLYGGQAP